MDLLLTLLKSKRTWVMIITAVAHLLASHHVLISDANIDAIADQAILIIGAVGVVGTKILDSKAAAAPAKQ
jgi:hypothetical protein